MRVHETLNILTTAKIIMYESLARTASSRWLDFYGMDYPEMDPPEWHKFITIKLEKGEVKTGETVHRLCRPASKASNARAGGRNAVVSRLFWLKSPLGRWIVKSVGTT